MCQTFDQLAENITNLMHKHYTLVSSLIFLR